MVDTVALKFMGDSSLDEKHEITEKMLLFPGVESVEELFPGETGDREHWWALKVQRDQTADVVDELCKMRLIECANVWTKHEGN